MSKSKSKNQYSLLNNECKVFLEGKSDQSLTKIDCIDQKIKLICSRYVMLENKIKEKQLEIQKLKNTNKYLEEENLKCKETIKKLKENPKLNHDNKQTEERIIKNNYSSNISNKLATWKVEEEKLIKNIDYQSQKKYHSYNSSLQKTNKQKERTIKNEKLQSNQEKQLENLIKRVNNQIKNQQKMINLEINQSKSPPKRYQKQNRKISPIQKLEIRTNNSYELKRSLTSNNFLKNNYQPTVSNDQTTLKKLWRERDEEISKLDEMFLKINEKIQTIEQTK